ncbi:MAG: serine--glyoxylate aminotransferase, partial [Pseudomonadota bacterium]
SQKGFMLPAGLAIVGVSPKAIAAMDTATSARCFFDFRDMIGAYSKGGYPYTPPVSMITGLSEALEMLLDEGLDAVHARHHRIAEGVRRAVAAWGLDLAAADPSLYSDTISAVRLPEGVDGDAFVKHAAEAYGVAFGIGLGEMAGKIFRIGHLGSMTDVMALSGIATAEMVMADMGIAVTPGSGVAAAQDYYRTSRTASAKTTTIDSKKAA